MTNLIKKVVLNTGLHTLGKFGASIMGVLIVAILTRYLGVEGFGAYTTIFAYLFFFAVLSDLGLYVITVNELGRSKFGEEHFFNNIFSLRFISALLLMLVACVLVWIFPYSDIIKLGVAVASFSVFLNLIDQIVVAFFQNKIKMKRVAVAELVGKTLTLVLVALFIYLDKGLLWVLVASVLGFAGNLIINLHYLTKYIRLNFEFDFKIWREIIIKSWPVALTTVFSLVYFKADTLFLSFLPINPAYASSNEMAVGIYGAPYKILEVLIAWPAIFMGLVSPLLSKDWRDKKIHNFKSKFQKAFDGLSIIIWPMIIGTLVLADPIIRLIAGAEFRSSALVLQILIWAVGIIFLTHLTTYAIIAIGKQRQIIKFYLFAAVMAVVGYVWLIPKFVYLAAAGVTIVVEGFMLIATLYLLYKYVELRLNLLVFGKSMLAAVMMGFILTFWINYNVVLLIIFGAVAYFVILWLIKGIRFNL